MKFILFIAQTLYCGVGCAARRMNGLRNYNFKCILPLAFTNYLVQHFAVYAVQIQGDGRMASLMFIDSKSKQN